MKKKLFIITFALISEVGFCNNLTIVNSGFTFSPSSITITLGDSVTFALASIHDAVEVSQATWNVNGTTPLSGGFTIPFGGGLALPSMLTIGTHYYVCSAHANIGMKGAITVQNPSGIAENQLHADISVYPNPCTDQFTISKSNSYTEGYDLEIYNIVGKKVYSDKIVGHTSYIVHPEWPSGIYFLYLKTSEGIEMKKLVISQLREL